MQPLAVAPTPKPSSAEDMYAFLELLDSRSEFESRLILGQRLGQAFVNSLPSEYDWLLAYSEKDPFWSNEPWVVYQALDYLLDRI